MLKATGIKLNQKGFKMTIQELKKELGLSNKEIAQFFNMTGNDAPRGGKNGDYIKVSRVALNFLNSLNK